MYSDACTARPRAQRKKEVTTFLRQQVVDSDGVAVDGWTSRWRSVNDPVA